MASEPFTIRIFVPSGDPEGVRIIDRMNWTGLGIAFPREKWSEAKNRKEFENAGVYILVGYNTEDEEDDLPIVYIGQGDGVRGRIDSHFQNKDFWDWGIVFISTSSGLNRAHITWLEYALIERALVVKQCRLDNGNTPQEPALSESEKADTDAFLKEIFQILPLANLRVFEIPKPVANPKITKTLDSENDTVVVPARKEGFEEVFLGEDCWRAIRISRRMQPKIKYIAAYQSHPISAITHYAEVDRIEPHGQTGKYKLVFIGKAKKIGPILHEDAKSGVMQGPRYTSFNKLKSAKKLTDLFDWA
jgi:hypothetical protein